MSEAGCVFCAIVRGEVEAHVVLDERPTVAFLDRRPLFPGHVLVVPRAHHETLMALPSAELEPLWTSVQRVARAVERALDAGGIFIAANNRVSQSVPHLHVHVVPRRKGDGLRGFFWPRRPYSDAEQMAEVRDAVRRELAAQE